MIEIEQHILIDHQWTASNVCIISFVFDNARTYCPSIFPSKIMFFICYLDFALEIDQQITLLCKNEFSGETRLGRKVVCQLQASDYFFRYATPQWLLTEVNDKDVKPTVKNVVDTENILNKWSTENMQ